MLKRLLRCTIQKEKIESKARKIWLLILGTLAPFQTYYVTAHHFDQLKNNKTNQLKLTRPLDNKTFLLFFHCSCIVRPISFIMSHSDFNKSADRSADKSSDKSEEKSADKSADECSRKLKILTICSLLVQRPSNIFHHIAF